MRLKILGRNDIVFTYFVLRYLNAKKTKGPLSEPFILTHCEAGLIQRFWQSRI